MTSTLAEWEAIPPPRDAATLNVLRADATHPLDFRIGRDARGRFVFQLDVVDFSPEIGSVDLPAGMDVVLDDVDGVARLTLILLDREDLDIFKVLCSDLLEIARGYGPDGGPRAMRALLARIARWQEILARRRRGRLSRNELVGLFGELIFLHEVLMHRVGAAAAVAAWRGPFGDEQDFVVAGSIVEVKTQVATSDARFVVSSEHQLDDSASPVHVCCQRLVPAAPPTGLSLDSLVGTLLARVEHLPSCSATLRAGLEAAGWSDAAGYDEAWRLEDRVYFRVADGFPRIVRADLRPGVERVRYQVMVADCLPFQVDEIAVFGEMAI